MPDYAALIERLEKLDGPSREVDLEILARVDQAGQWSENDIAYALSDVEGTTAPTAYTASIDAAVDLVERALRPTHPHMTVNLRGIYDSPKHAGWWRAEITWPSHERVGHSPQAAIAILIATLKALQETSANER